MSRGKAALSFAAPFALAFAGPLALAGCNHQCEVDPFGAPPTGTLQSAWTPVTDAAAASADNCSAGNGGISVTSTADPAGYFVATIRVSLRAKANKTYLLQRAAEVGRENGADGLCQRADGLAPWSPGDPPFGGTWVTFPLPVATELKKVATDAKGEGALEFEYRSPTIPSGTRFDVRMRLVDDESAPTSELRSGCMTVVVK